MLINMFSKQMIEIFETTPILHNNSIAYSFWLTLYVILLIYPYQYIWYIPYLLMMAYISLVFITIKFVNEYLI
jgi:hypothetical protein